MAYRFHCALQSRTLPEQNGTIRGLDNAEYFLVNGVLDGTVYQLGRDGTQSAVGLLQKIYYDLNDQEQTLILYSDGCLGFHEWIDAVPPEIRTERYFGERARQCFLLHKNYELVFVNGVGRETLKQAVLECEGSRYPIQADWDEQYNVSALTVFRPSPQAGHGHTRLARVARIDNMHYDIWMEEIPSALFCAAVWSLAISV